MLRRCGYVPPKRRAAYRLSKEDKAALRKRLVPLWSRRRRAELSGNAEVAAGICSEIAATELAFIGTLKLSEPPAANKPPLDDYFRNRRRVLRDALMEAVSRDDAVAIAAASAALNDFIQTQTQTTTETVEIAPKSVPVSGVKPLLHYSEDGIAHQRKIRDDKLQTDLAVLGFDPPKDCSEFVLTYEPAMPEHREFIRKYEWLGNAGFGVRWTFTARFNGVLGGVIMLSEPYAYRKELGVDLECLIQRGACAGWTPKNLGSKLIMFAVRWMAANTPKRVFYGYSDPRAGEIGTLYQACNFTFLGYRTKTVTVDKEGRERSKQALERTSKMLPWLKSQGITLRPECFTEKGYIRWSAVPDDIRALMRGRVNARVAELGLVSSRVEHGCYGLVLGSATEVKHLTRKMCWEKHPYPKRCVPVVTA